MKKFIQSIRFLCILGCLAMVQGLYAQESLDLLAKLDKGLPPSGLNGSGLGEVVAYIGDVNNDGFDDWAVGLPNAADYETGAYFGKVYIYFGGSLIQSNQNPDLILSGKDKNNNFGRQVASAGDVNKDGFSDLLITNNKEVKLYLGGNPLDTMPDVIFTIEGFQGIASAAGDVNNDGFDDILIPSTDRVYIFYGGRKMDTQPDIILKEEQERGVLQFTVSKAGDMNKDGFDDIIIGTQGFSLNGYNVGKVSVYYGGAEMDTIADLVMTGEHSGDFFGGTVSDAGDLNNDGYDDVLVNATRYKNINKEDGRVYVYYGGNANDTIADILIDGIDGQSAGDINRDGFDDLLIKQSVYWGGSLMDSIPDYNFTIPFNFTSIPKFAGAGDYNNDGYADILTGQANDSQNGERAGCVSVFFGGQQLKSNPDLVFYGVPMEDYFGDSVSSAGDLNKDGYDDFIIGSVGNDKAEKNGGCVDIYLGGSSINDQPALTLTGQKANDQFGHCVSTAGDVNNDGYSDFLVGGLFTNQVNLYLGNKEMDKLASYILEGEKPGSAFGYSVSNAGDFNRDGFDDYIIGDPWNDIKGPNTGKAYFYFGGPSIDTNPDLIFQGETKYNGFGAAVASAGDINNDGFPDIMIGAPSYDTREVHGRLYVYFGSSSPDTIPDVVINGYNNYQRLGMVIASAGDVNNDSYDDIIVGMPNYASSPSGINYINLYYGGAVMDTIPDVKIVKRGYCFGNGISTAGDLNNDGYDDVMIGGNDRLYVYYGGLAMDTIPDMVIQEEHNWWNAFGRSLSLAGDVNNDGRTDLLVGNPTSSAIGNNMGRIYIYSSQVIKTGMEIVKENSHHQIYPNPFTTETTIQYQLQKSGRVMIKIFNTSGQEIETLVNASQPKGDYKITWHPKDLPNGMYFCKIQSSESSETKKMMLQR